MKSKLIITLTALLMLGGISAMAQGSFPKGDINEDGVVNAADVVALVNIIRAYKFALGDARNPVLARRMTGRQIQHRHDGLTPLIPGHFFVQNHGVPLYNAFDGKHDDLPVACHIFA